MNSLLLFLLKSTLSLSLLYIAYRLLMHRETFFKLNRMVLLFTVLYSMVVPFLYFPQQFKPTVHEKIVTVFQNVTISEEPTQAVNEPIDAQLSQPVKETIQPITLSPSVIFNFVYLSGVFVTFLLFVYSVGRVLLLFRKAQKVEFKGIRLMIVAEDIPAFSFGRNILISQHDYENNSEAIITHEQSHIRLGHFFDLMLMELVKIIFWFNPLVYRMLRDLKEIHEFQADNHTLTTGIDATKYQLLIIQKSVGPQKFALANSFNHCQIKNRIVMMNKQKTSKARRWKVATFLPLLALFLMAFGKPGENDAPEKGLLPYITSLTLQDSIRHWTEEDFIELTGPNMKEMFEKRSENYSYPLEMINLHIDNKSKITINTKPNVWESINLNEIHSFIEKSWTYNDKLKKIIPIPLVLISKDSTTLQADYLKLLNVAANSILQIRDNFSEKLYGSSYNKLQTNQHNLIDQLIPMNVVYSRAKLEKMKAPPPLSSSKKSARYELQNRTIEIKKEGNYIDNKLYSLEELVKKGQEWIKASNNWILLLTDKSIPFKRIDEVIGALKNAKVYHIILSNVNSDEMIFPAGDVTVSAKFKHGKWGDWLTNQLNNYPEEKSRDSDYKLTYFFIVDKNGKVRDGHVVEGDNPEINAAMDKILTQLPDWEPAKRGSNKVSVYYMEGRARKTFKPPVIKKK